jgi:ribosomal protein S18 acetylase RimI-like enzyme
MSYKVRKLTSEALDAAADVLAAAFFDDPGFRYLIPREMDRRRWMPVAFREHLRMVSVNGHAYVMTDEEDCVLGVVAATPPGKYPHPFRRVLRMFWRVVWKPRPWCPPFRRYWTLWKYFRACEAMHPKFPHWYGEVLGVRPEYRGTPIGKRLGRIITDLADQDGQPIYLEAGNANVALYLAFGFEVGETRHPSKNGPPICGMLRPAAEAQQSRSDRVAS